MKKLFILGVLVCVNLLAFAQKYYIEGTIKQELTENGQSVILQNPIGHGIFFEPVSSIVGTEEKNGQYSFRFKRASTNCPDGFEGGMVFSRKINEKWQIDGEVDQGLARFSDENSMAIVLVLDCSHSLGDNFAKVKESAISFINLLYDRGGNKGNIHIGVVAFNYQNYVQEIVPLTDSNKASLIRFISNLTKEKSTRLYTAMDKGVSMIENYVEQKALKNFDGATLVTFTDGLDNGSVKTEKGKVWDNDMYFTELQKIIKTTRIKGKELESYVISVKGDDVQDDQDFINSRLKPFASSEGKYYPMTNFDELAQLFEKIAQNLITRWRDLFCYVNPKSGEVRWVLNCGEPEPEPEPEPRPKSVPKADFRFIASGSFYSNFYHTSGKELTLTFCFQIVPKFHFGLGLGVNFNSDYDNGLLPVFADFKYDILENKRVSPFVRGRIGYAFIGNDSDAPYWDFVAGVSFYSKKRDFGYSIFVGINGAKTWDFGNYGEFYYYHIPCYKIGMALEFGRAQ